MSKSSRPGGKEAPKSEPAPAVSGEDTPCPKIDLRDAHAMRREMNALYREARAGIRHVSATEPYLMMPTLEADAAFQREMTEAMRQALE